MPSWPSTPTMTSKPRRLRSRLSDSRFISSSSTINIFGICINSKQIQGSRLRGRRLHAVEQGEQFLAIHRLGEDVDRSQTEGSIALFENGCQYHRNFLERRIFLKLGQHAPAIHARHDYVEDDHVRAELMSEPEPIQSVACRSDLK